MREYTYALWNRARGSALAQRGGLGPTGSLGMVIGAGPVLTALPFILSRSGFGVSVASPAAFVVDDSLLHFPQPSGERADADWFAGADLVVLQSRYAGVFTRRVNVGTFMIPPTPTD